MREPEENDVKAARLSRFGKPAEVIELADVPDPAAPQADEVLIEVIACPINPADVLMLEGLYGASPPKLPLVPGAEGLGRVARVGSGVKHVKPGDLVLAPGPGTWRERMTVPAAAVWALRSKADVHQLAMLRVNPATAYLMLHDYVPAKAGSWVIQNAANSGVGHCLIRLARQAGVKTVNVVRRESLVAPLEAYGADVVLVDGPDLDARVRDATGGAPLPLAIDAVGGSATQRLARSVDEKGVVVNYGLLSGEPCMIDVRDTVFRDVSLRGFWLRRWFAETHSADIGKLYAKLAALVEDGTLQVEVEQVYPLAKIKDAVAHAAREGREGKILIEMARS
ncbi:MAG: zinc-dependent alcohol dehydrogenase family protein [Burkholderiales bacterium]|nr:zinc-dependent alcohol dehydrogenase family protein [Burkholderiales bacterium]